MPTVQILIEGATGVIELRKLKNELIPKGEPGEYPEDADVICEKIALVDGGPAIVGTDNILMPHVAGTTGKKTLYRGVIPSSAGLQKGTAPKAYIHAEVAGGERPFVILCKVIQG